MDFELSEEHKMLRQNLRNLVDKEVIPLEPVVRERNARFLELPPKYRAPIEEKVKAMGLWMPFLPKEYGGGGLEDILGSVGACVITEETHRSPLAQGIMGRGPDVLLYNASEVVKQKYLWPTLRGERRGSTGFSEPQAGGDVAGIQSTAEKVPGGYVLNGTKIWGNHPKADYCTVLARMKGTSRHEGLTLFVVDRENPAKKTPGWKLVRPISNMFGPDEQGEIHLDNVFVPDEQRLTPEGGGWGPSQARWTRIRSRTGANCLGWAGRSQELAISWSKLRVTFGQPLSQRQAVQWMLADSEMDLLATRLLTYHAAAKADKGLDMRHEASIVKVFATEAASRVIDRALQIHGGMGFSSELPIEYFYRAVRAERILDGPSEVHRMVVARNLLRA